MYRKLNVQESSMVSYKKELTEKPQLLVLDWSNEYFDIWKDYAEKHYNEIIWMGSNVSKFHEENWCNRKDVNWKSLYKSWEWYDICPWCNPKTSHSEPDSIDDCIKKGNLDKLKDSTLFLYGHFWPCPNCWETCREYWIKNIIVQEKSFHLHKNR